MKTYYLAVILLIIATGCQNTSSNLSNKQRVKPKCRSVEDYKFNKTTIVEEYRTNEFKCFIRMKDLLNCKYRVLESSKNYFHFLCPNTIKAKLEDLGDMELCPNSSSLAGGFQYRFWKPKGMSLKNFKLTNKHRMTGPVSQAGYYIFAVSKDGTQAIAAKSRWLSYQFNIIKNEKGRVLPLVIKVKAFPMKNGLYYLQAFVAEAVLDQEAEVTKERKE